MDNDQAAFIKETAQHTRMAHFSLVATSIVLIVLALTYREASVDRALSELSDVRRLAAAFGQKDIYSIFGESDQAPVNFVGIDDPSEAETRYVCIPEFEGIRHISWLDSAAHLKNVTLQAPQFESLAEDEAPWIDWLLWSSPDWSVELPKLPSSLTFDEIANVWENRPDIELDNWHDTGNALLWLSIDPVPDSLYRLSNVNSELSDTPLAELKDAWNKAHNGGFVEISQSRLLGVASWADSMILDFDAPQKNQNIFRCLDDLGPTYLFSGRQIIERLDQPEVDFFLGSHDLADLVKHLGSDAFSPNSTYVIGETGVITVDDLDEPTSASVSPAAYILETVISREGISVLPAFLTLNSGELADAPFDEAFDDVEGNLGEALSLTLDEAEALLGSSLFQSRDDVSLLGVSFPTALATSSGLSILVVAQLYFLLHLQQFRRRFETVPRIVEFPWIALYPDPLARIIFIFSVGLLPGLAIFALSRIDSGVFDVVLGPQLIYTILFGLLGAGCAVATTATAISLPRFIQR